MSAHYEPHCEHGCGVIRVYEGWNSYETKSPFKLSLAVRVDRNEAYLFALQAENYSGSDWDAVNNCLARNGFMKAHWLRYKNGKRVNISHPVVQLKESPIMDVQTAIDAAGEKINHALAEANTHGFSELAGYWSTVKTAHDAAKAGAVNTDADYSERVAPLLPGLRALQAIKKWGRSHPDQTHPVHASSKAAAAAVGRVIIAVTQAEIALVE